MPEITVTADQLARHFGVPLNWLEVNIAES